jgi:hypothetical protein
MGKILPVIMALIGLAAGTGGGYVLRPAPADPTPSGESSDAHASHSATTTAETAAPAHDYVKLNNQFVIPVVESGQIAALVILSLSLEVAVGGSEHVYAVEPKLRDNLLQVLFNHANVGGFRGAFTESRNMDTLRSALLEAARTTLGNTVSNVLIADIVRQDSS